MGESAPVVAAVDWGTSHLRVWLLDNQGASIAEQRTDEGLTKASGIGFAAVLERILTSLGAASDLPAIVCGMAGSKQGWVEAPYLDTPVRITDILEGAVPVPGVDRVVRIIPGIAQRTRGAADVMRGEETQLTGCEQRFAAGAQLICMPGTHSKWVEVENGAVKGFSTWLTGELFALLSTSSILRHSIGQHVEVSPADPAFAHWVNEALASPQDMTRRFFGLRAGSLLHGMTPADAAAALSGQLIGVEIASARPWERAPGKEVLLIASGRLRDLYTEALRLAGCGITPVDADEAVRAGLFAAARQCGLASKGADA